LTNIVKLPDRTGYAADMQEELACLDAIEQALYSVNAKWQREKILKLVNDLHARGFKIVRKGV
jgi:hypothetical protein